MQLVPTKWQIHGMPSIPETNHLIPSRTFGHIGLNNETKSENLIARSYDLYTYSSCHIEKIVQLMSC